MFKNCLAFWNLQDAVSVGRCEGAQCPRSSLWLGRRFFLDEGPGEHISVPTTVRFLLRLDPDSAPNTFQLLWRSCGPHFLGCEGLRRGLQEQTWFLSTAVLRDAPDLQCHQNLFSPLLASGAYLVRILLKVTAALVTCIG